ncbi:MAG: DNA polymerase [Oscillospiraceae bacterium]
MFGVPTEAVTKQMRSHAKAVNFGIVYGISAFSLAQDIGVSVYEAKEYIQNYLDRFSGVRRYMTEIVEKAKAQGYVETLMHRRRDLPELTASNFATRSFGERVALNMPIQGTAADVMKLAMVRVHDRLRREAPEAKLLLQVHDELIVECPEAMAEQAARLLTEEMEGVMQLSVPLVAEAHWGKTGWRQRDERKGHAGADRTDENGAPRRGGGAGAQLLHRAVVAQCACRGAGQRALGLSRRAGRK